MKTRVKTKTKTTKKMKMKKTTLRLPAGRKRAARLAQGPCSCSRLQPKSENPEALDPTHPKPYKPSTPKKF